jgi:arsenate reductase
MAEAFLRQMAGDRFEAFSAGLEPVEIHPLTRQVMAEVGLDLRGQYAKSVTKYMGKLHFGYLITVCANADKHCPTTFPGVGQRVHWDIDDPAAFQGSEPERLQEFRRARDGVKTRIEEWVRSF